MSLRAFHILFITVSACCCAALGVWSVDRVRAGDSAALWQGGIAVAGIAALIVYLRWFLKKDRGGNA